MKESYEVILTSSASSQVNTQTVKGRDWYILSSVFKKYRKSGAFFIFSERGAKKIIIITISIAHNESKGEYWERLYLMS